MPIAEVGQNVVVNISGLNAPGVQIGGAGVTAAGVITAVDNVQGLITVKLAVAFAGNDTVVVTADRVQLTQ